MIYPIPPRSVPGKDSLAYWEDFLTQEDINLILAQPEWLQLQPGCIGGSSLDGMVDKNVRTTELAWLTRKPELEHIWKKFAEATAEINSRFFQYDIDGFHEPMQLGVYHAADNGHYNWHTDASHTDRNVPRKLSIAMLLSDPSEFEGGDLQVKQYSDEVQTLEIKKGRAWFFPSYMLHKVTPVTKGTRRSLVLWVGGPAFK